MTVRIEFSSIAAQIDIECERGGKNESTVCPMERVRRILPREEEEK